MRSIGYGIILTLYSAARQVAVRTGLVQPLRRVRDWCLKSTGKDLEFRAMQMRPVAEKILHVILRPSELIDRFDADYLDDLVVILRENYGITEENFSNHYIYSRIQPVWDYYWGEEKALMLSDLYPFFVSRLKVDRRQFSPLVALRRVKRRQNLHMTPLFYKIKGRKIKGPEDVELNNRYQLGVSRLSGAAKRLDPHDFANWFPGTEPLIQLLQDFVTKGRVNANEAVLDVGPRSLSEIRYFREIIGLKNTIGLDLFTDEESLVKVGDMHDMPFETNYFGLVFTRNTIDKSYDIRRFLSELVRVTRPDGIVCLETSFDYIEGCTELGRTNVKKCSQILRVLGASVGEIFLCEDVISHNNYARIVGVIAFRVSK